MATTNDSKNQSIKMSISYLIIFISIALSIYFGMHYYVYIRIAKGLEISDKIGLYLKILMALAGLSFFLGEITRRYLNFEPVLHIGVLWLGIIAISFSIFLLKDILGIVLPLKSMQATIGTLVLICLVVGYSIFNVARGPCIKELTIPLRKLPPELSEFTIIQLSDLHLESKNSDKWLSSVVDRTNAFNPDLIVITGDLLDENICQINKLCDIMKRLKSKNGIVAVTGNHEYYAGIHNFLEVVKELNIILLRNSKTIIAGNSIELIGVDDPQGRRFGEKGPDLGSALKNVDFAKPVILLSHYPDLFDQATKSGVDLQLSGHTHAGQIPPMDLIVQFYFKYPFGLYHKGSSYLYTTSGTGLWGPPMRLFSRSEIVKITLKPQDIKTLENKN
jgi:uncharacterized protein